MKDLSYQRIYKSREYLSALGQIRYRALFGGYSLSVDGTVFAMVSNGDLYLRACEQSAEYRSQHAAPLLTFMKRGRPVLLNYYRVDESLWHDPQKLNTLSSWSLAAAKTEKMQRSGAPRLKDLPNLTFQLETLLREAGVPDYATLRQLGSKTCWVRIRHLNSHLGIKVLFALEGAIVGLHEAALPALTRQALTDWFNDFQKEHDAPHWGI
ncbi:TfoX/Sxy family DNA transformation protein [Enterobacter sp.]|uniref:TfoX/Sxy family DNA transformation protein n=1 Tax=Enterobacter sp. TaxID=42895 RepID=UPI00296F5F17|nr:TfoX/Sxy family DNA transformation protein [Enterobacter sp.]